MKKNKKIIIAIAAIVIIIVLALVLTQVLTKKDGGIFNFDKKGTEEKITKMVENDKIKVEVNRTSYEEGYLIVEYNITSKDGADYFDNCFDTTNGLDYYLERTISINGEKIKESDQSLQLAERVSDTEAKLYDFVEVSENEIKDNSKIEINVFDTSDIYEYDESEYIEETQYEESDSEEESEYIEENEDEYIENEEEEEEYIEDGYEEVEGEYIEGTDEEIEENETNEESDEETSDEETSDEEMEDEEIDDYDDEITEDIEDEYESEGELLGKITLNVKKDEMTQDTNSTEIMDSTYEYEDMSITKAKLIETPIGKFIIIDSEVKNVTDADIFSEDISVTNMELNIQDENGNTINASKQTGYSIILEDGTDWADSTEDTFSNGVLKFRTIVSLNKQKDEINKLKIVPIVTQYYEETEEELNAMNWNKVVDGKYEATSEYGAKIEITKIEEKDGNLNFYYKDSGLIVEADSFIIVRNVEKGDYVVGSGRKITESGEKVITFKMDDENTEEEFAYLNNIDNLEFAVFEGVKVIPVGEGTQIEF